MLWQSWIDCASEICHYKHNFHKLQKKKTCTRMNSAVFFTTKAMTHIYRSDLEQEHASEIAETVHFQGILGSEK